MVEVQICEVDALPALFSSGLGLFSVVGFPWLHFIPSLTDVTMEIKTCTLTKAVKLYYIKLNKWNEMKLR
jgi:hypothetical protein